MWLDTIKLGFYNNLILGDTPTVLDAEKIIDVLMKERQMVIESFGLFDSSTPNYTTYYPEVKAEDLKPKADEFIEPLFRALSEVIVHKNWNPVDFSQGNVLKNSKGLLIGATVNPDHESSMVGNAIGAVSKVAWEDSYKTDKGIVVPAGINAVLKIDGKSNPRIARGVMMDPPSIHSSSVTVQFMWDKSHDLPDDEFFQKLGTKDKEGVMIRRMATKIKKYPEISLVHHGADPYAQKVNEDGEINNPKYADTSYNSETIQKRKDQKYFTFDMKTDLIANAEENTIPAISNDNSNPSDMKEFLVKLAAKLGITAGEHTEESLMAALAVKLTELSTANTSVTTLTAEVARLKPLETELIALKAAQPNAEKMASLVAFETKIISDARARVTTAYNKLKDNKPDANITAMIAGATNLESLLALETEYTTQLEAKFPQACGACGSTNITRASSKPSGEDAGGAGPKTSDDAIQNLEKKHRKQSRIQLGFDEPKAKA